MTRYAARTSTDQHTEIDGSERALGFTRSHVLRPYGTRPKLFAAVAAFGMIFAWACGDDDESTPGPSLSPTPGVTLPPGVSGTPQALPEQTISFETDGATVELTVEVADDGAEQGLGLMFRESMAEERGMLFDFGQESLRSFYMRNTLIPLSLAFMTADGTIVDIQDMEPLTEESHVSPAPVRYGLEVNQGWFERNGVVIGGVMTIGS